MRLRKPRLNPKRNDFRRLTICFRTEKTQTALRGLSFLFRYYQSEYCQDFDISPKEKTFMVFLVRL
jgi:hypothetical protein